MENRVDIPGYMAAESGVAHISADNLEVGMGMSLEPAPVVERIILTKGSDLYPLGKKKVDKMGTDKTVGSGHKCIFYISWHRICFNLKG